MDPAERAARLIPAGTQTYSKRRDQFPSNAPTHIQRGRGAHVWDADGNEFVDWTMGLGAISLGYGDPDMDAAVCRQLGEGTIFGLAHRIEVELAEELAPLMPWPDPMFRYGKNGSDATSAAVRAARAITKRDHIISFGYHGWQDWSCPNQSGIPEDVRDLTRVVPQRAADRTDRRTQIIETEACRYFSCVIVEPDTCPGLIGLRRLCDETGMLLIFDEVLTGFRYPGFTYAAYSGVTPDLICLGKAIANGFPLSVIAGPRRYMEVFGGGIGYSTTFGGETLSIAAALATVRKYRREPVVERLWSVGAEVQDHWNAQARSVGLDIRCEGDPPRSVVRYPSPAHKTLVMERMFERGVMCTVGFTSCYAHAQKDVEVTKSAVTYALAALAEAGDHPEARVEGELVGAPYRAR